MVFVFYPSFIFCHWFCHALFQTCCGWVFATSATLWYSEISSLLFWLASFRFVLLILPLLPGWCANFLRTMLYRILNTQIDYYKQACFDRVLAYTFISLCMTDFFIFIFRSIGPSSLPLMPAGIYFHLLNYPHDALCNRYFHHWQWTFWLESISFLRFFVLYHPDRFLSYFISRTQRH